MAVALLGLWSDVRNLKSMTVPLTLTPTGMATGGEAVGRDDGGRAVFVSGALPGERVAVELSEEKKRFARGHVVDVLEPSPARRIPSCSHFVAGCGGCDWQFIDSSTQPELRLQLVRESLIRMSGIADPPVTKGVELQGWEGRTSLRCVIQESKPALRRRHSHDLVFIDSCEVAHPMITQALALGEFGETTEITLKVGARTGQALAVATPNGEGVSLPAPWQVVGSDDDEAWIEEVAGGRSWRVSAKSFFQSSPQAVDALVFEVSTALGLVESFDHLIDVGAGVGVFAGTVGDRFERVSAIEPAASSAADARANVPRAEVFEQTLNQWMPSAADLVVADPPRAGLGAKGVATIAKTESPVVVLISCDVAALGRDAKDLLEAGYELVRTAVLDLFPNTSHVEACSTFVAR